MLSISAILPQAVERAVNFHLVNAAMLNIGAILPQGGDTRKAAAFINEAPDAPSRFRPRRKLKAGEGVIANNALINEAPDAPSRFRPRLRLKAGEGVIANNALLMRNAFSEDPQRTRLLYRMRWPMRVGGRRQEGRLPC